MVCSLCLPPFCHLLHLYFPLPLFLTILELFSHTYCCCHHQSFCHWATLYAAAAAVALLSSFTLPARSNPARTKIKNCHSQGWRAGSVLKRACCSPRRPEFSSHHSHQVVHDYLKPQFQGVQHLWLLLAPSFMCPYTQAHTHTLLGIRQDPLIRHHTAMLGVVPPALTVNQAAWVNNQES